MKKTDIEVLGNENIYKMTKGVDVSFDVIFLRGRIKITFNNIEPSTKQSKIWFWVQLNDSWDVPFIVLKFVTLRASSNRLVFRAALSTCDFKLFLRNFSQANLKRML